MGLGLRFWQLASKPLWLDEVITAIFTMGRSYQDVPLQVLFPLSALNTLFSFQSGVSCSQIAQTVATESVHPPLFFCLLYGWVGWLHSWTEGLGIENWVWVLRSFPALIGVGGIAALYGLNRVAFSPRAGLIGAALMAVSPFAVYLSQEARHYTLPMLLMAIALLGLIEIQRDLMSPNRFRPVVWLGWCVVNVIGLYTHYFCAIALVAQVGALFGWIVLQKRKLTRYQWGAIALALGGIALCYLPWFPTMIDHFNRPETDWLSPYRPDWKDRIAPLYQTLVNWVLMVIALPVENQPDRVVIGMAVIMLVVAVWIAGQVIRGFRQLWNNSANRPAVQLIGGFIGGVMLQFFAIVYLLDKDITVVPRYNFIYYPAVCALLGACLQELGTKDTRQEIPPIPNSRDQSRLYVPSPHPNSRDQSRLYSPVLLILLASFIRSLFVVNGLVFQKSYYPARAARNMAFEPDKPLISVVSYESLQEVALGLSFALELKRRYPETTIDSLVRFGVLDRSSGYSQVWRAFPDLEQPLPLPLNLWVVASPGMRTKDYPQRLRINDPNAARRALCPVDPDQLHRLGFPYQLFRCESQRR